MFRFDLIIKSVASLLDDNFKSFPKHSYTKITVNLKLKWSIHQKLPWILRDKTFLDKVMSFQMMINKITTSVYDNLWLTRLVTHINEPTNKNLIIVSKVVKPTNYYKTLGTSVVNSPMSPPSLKNFPQTKCCF